MLWPMASQPVCSGIRPPSGTHIQFFFPFHCLCLLRVVAFPLYYGVPSLMRGWDCQFSVREHSKQSFVRYIYMMVARSLPSQARYSKFMPC
jgi:hypothetical protein